MDWASFAEMLVHDNGSYLAFGDARYPYQASDLEREEGFALLRRNAHSHASSELITERSLCNESPEYPATESILCTARTQTANHHNVKSIRSAVFWRSHEKNKSLCYNKTTGHGVRGRMTVSIERRGGPRKPFGTGSTPVGSTRSLFPPLLQSQHAVIG